MVQEGFVGLMMAYHKFNPHKGVSLGAFASRYIFGRIYRSLLGTKNLVHNKKMLLMELSDKIIDTNADHEFLIELNDYIDTKYQGEDAEILRHFLSGHKKTELVKKFKKSMEDIDGLLQQFYHGYEHSVILHIE